MNRIFLRILLSDGRRIVVRDPDEWTDLQEELPGPLYRDLSSEERDRFRQEATAVQVVADGGDQTVLVEFDSLSQWKQRGQGLHRTPLWLSGWLVARLNSLVGNDSGYQTLQELVTELLIAALRRQAGGEEVGTSPLILRIQVEGDRTLVVHSPPGQPWGYVQEEVAPGRYRDLPATDPLANHGRLADLARWVEVVAIVTPVDSVVVGRFDRQEWRACTERQIISPRLPSWLVYQLDELKKDGGGARRHIVEKWLQAGLVDLARRPGV